MTLLKSVATPICPILKLRRQGTILHTLSYEPSELPFARHSAMILIICKNTDSDTYRTKAPLSVRKDRYEESLKYIRLQKTKNYCSTNCIKVKFYCHILSLWLAYNNYNVVHIYIPHLVLSGEVLRQNPFSSLVYLTDTAKTL